MRKFLFLLLITLFIQPVFAADNISFVYINGSNNNDVKMKKWYIDGVKKLHPVMRKKFLKNSTIKKHFANLGGITIKEEPVIFFWGDKSRKDLNFVKDQLELSKAVSSTGAYVVRSLVSKYLHDAIWVQKSHNMETVLDDLNKKVKKEAKTGNSVILYGYSAGTFVTYEYFFSRLRYIDLDDFFDLLDVDDDVVEFAKNNQMKNTCVAALAPKSGGIGVLSASGHFILNQNKEKLKENYLKIDEITEEVCAPEDKVFGIVNFASPLPLFYSDLADDEYELNFYNRLMIKYIMEKGLFILTVNFKEDPLGFPTSENLTAQDIEDIIGLDIIDPQGVIYDNSGVWSRRLFPFAHTSYWSARRIFSNAVVKSLITGYKFQYDEKYQQKVLKKGSKKFEL